MRASAKISEISKEEVCSMDLVFLKCLFSSEAQPATGWF